jgi:hypothetical protein
MNRYYCHDCNHQTVPETIDPGDPMPPTCGECGSEYLCDECGTMLEQDFSCPRAESHD